MSTEIKHCSEGKLSVSSLLLWGMAAGRGFPLSSVSLQCGGS